jgi:hypothetical protein
LWTNSSANFWRRENRENNENGKRNKHTGENHIYLFRGFLFLIGSLLVFSYWSVEGDSVNPRKREKIKYGMSMKEVCDLLGKPDEVITDRKKICDILWEPKEVNAKGDIVLFFYGSAWQWHSYRVKFKDDKVVVTQYDNG